MVASIGAITLLKVEELPAAARLQGQVIEARDEDVNKNPDLYAALIRAQLRAMRMINENAGEVGIALGKTRFSSIKPELWPLVWQNNFASFRSPYVKPDSLQAWIETGLIGGNPDPKTFPYHEVIDMQFVDAGLKRIAWNIAD